MQSAKKEESKRGGGRKVEKVSKEASSASKKEPEKEPEQEPEKFSGVTFQIAVAGVIYFLVNLFMSKKEPKLTNIFTNDIIFDVDFYLTSTKELSVINNLKPFYTLKDRKFCYSGDKDLSLQNVYDVEVNTTFNISYLKNVKDHEKDVLYLVSKINFHDKSIQRKQMKDYDIPEDRYYQSINILKFVSHSSSKVEEDIFDDLPSSSATPKVLPNKTIEGLYYKPSISLYISKLSGEERVSTLKEYNFFGPGLFVDQEMKHFFPIFMPTDFWTLSNELEPVLDKEVIPINLKLSFGYLQNFLLLQLFSLQRSGEIMEKKFGVPNSIETVAEILKFNSIPYITTLLVVNTLHSIFSILGFSSDISYYKKLQRLDGVYTRSIFFSLFQTVVALLYVLIKGANFLVKIELFISGVIEVWKFLKIFKINFSSKFPFFSFNYKLDHKKEESKQYEKDAVNFMIKFLLIPIMIIYLGYRLYYYRTTSIFDFIISYIFFSMNIYGFILMTPQVYLNYKLKSVEHLPMRAMAFKFLNTIIDDLYAFAVKTPVMYRIFCFKDDVIFVIYIYQIFIYRKNRNDDEEETKKIEGEKVKKD